MLTLYEHSVIGDMNSKDYLRLMHYSSLFKLYLILKPQCYATKKMQCSALSSLGLNLCL